MEYFLIIFSYNVAESERKILNQFYAGKIKGKNIKHINHRFFNYFPIGTMSSFSYMTFV